MQTDIYTDYIFHKYKKLVKEDKQLENNKCLLDYYTKSCQQDESIDKKKILYEINTFLLPHQSIVKELNIRYPNSKGLILFHNMGSGKTISSISISYDFINSNKNLSMNKILVVVPGPLLKNNYKENLFFYINIQNASMDKEDIKKFIDNYYNIITYDNLSKIINENKISNYIAKQNRKSLVIIDEIHHLYENEVSERLIRMVKDIRKDTSHQLKLILLSGTPIYNLPSSIVSILNLLKDTKDQKEEEYFFRNKIYLQKDKLAEFKEFAKDCISYFDKFDNKLYAKHRDIGIYNPFVKNLKLVVCKLSTYHSNTLLKYVQHISSNYKITNVKMFPIFVSLSNMCFPILDKNNKIQFVSRKLFLNYFKDLHVKKVWLTIINNKFRTSKKKIPLSIDVNIKKDDCDIIEGSIFHKDYLPIFSMKLMTLYQNIIKYEGLHFIYSQFIQFGTSYIEEMLVNNGFLRYRKDRKYTLLNNTLHYTGQFTYSEWNKINTKKEIFFPAVFITIKGTKGYENTNVNYLKEFNTNNILGTKIRIIIGSKISQEGINFKNVTNVHLFNPWYTLKTEEQIIARAIRQCSHYDLINLQNKVPEVNVYRYCSSFVNFSKTPTFEESIYALSELKYNHISKIEEILKSVSVDCPLHYHIGYKLRCYEKSLEVYYDTKKKGYKNLSFAELHKNRSYIETEKNKKNEINSYIDIIKDMYYYYPNYSFEEIKKYIFSLLPIADENFIILSIDKMIAYKIRLFDKFSNIGFIYYNTIDKRYHFITKITNYQDRMEVSTDRNIYQDNITLNDLIRDIEQEKESDKSIKIPMNCIQYYSFRESLINDIYLIYYDKKIKKIKLKTNDKIIDNQVGQYCFSFDKKTLEYIYNNIMDIYKNEINKYLPRDFQTLLEKRVFYNYRNNSKNNICNQLFYMFEILHKYNNQKKIYVLYVKNECSIESKMFENLFMTKQFLFDNNCTFIGYEIIHNDLYLQFKYDIAFKKIEDKIKIKKYNKDIVVI